MISTAPLDNLLSAKVEIFADGEDYLSNFTLNLPDEDIIDIRILRALEEALQHSHYKIHKLVLSLQND